MDIRKKQRAVVEALEDVKARDIVTRAALENAIRVDMALGGSSNTVLHMMAISHEARAARGAAAISTAPKISAFFINSSFLRMGFLSQNSSNGGGE